MRFLILIQLLLYNISIICGSYVLKAEWDQTPLSCRIIICAFIIVQILYAIGSIQSLITMKGG